MHVRFALRVVLHVVGLRWIVTGACVVSPTTYPLVAVVSDIGFLGSDGGASVVVMKKKS